MIPFSQPKPEIPEPTKICETVSWSCEYIVMYEAGKNAEYKVLHSELTPEEAMAWAKGISETDLGGSHVKGHDYALKGWLLW